MVDTVSTKVLFSGSNNYSIRITGVSDSTGESDVVKIDKSSLVGPLGREPENIKVMDITWDISGWDAVNLEWDGSTDSVAFVLSTNGFEDFSKTGGLVADNADGTGDLLLTTVGAGAIGDSYTITLNCVLRGGI